MYQNKDGVLLNLNYARASSVGVDPVEKKPLCHFFPGSTVFSLGGWGCNFHCPGCQNYEISCVDVVDTGYGSREIQPMQAIEQAQRNRYDGMAWTYNEPTVWFEYTLDSAKLAKENNLYTVYVTNGYMTAEALDMIGPYMDAMSVDIKGFNDNTYKRLAKVSKWRGILDIIKQAKDKWNMHIEVVTNIVPTINDNEEQLGDIARWIRNELGELTPWHVSRFYPQNRMTDIPHTPVSTLEHACDIGQKAGLKYIYIGNVPGHDSESTVCHSCGKKVVKRKGYYTEASGLKGSECRFCGTELNFRI